MRTNRPRIRKALKVDNIAESLYLNATIVIVVQDGYTHTVEILRDMDEGVPFVSLAYDPSDRTVLGSISPEILSPCFQGPDLLRFLSDTLLSKIGAKELLLVPEDSAVPNFAVPESKPENSERLRHMDPVQLKETTQQILAQYPEAVAALNTQYHFVQDEASFTKGHDLQKRYAQVDAILEQSRFTLDKLKEYKNEELQGKIARFRSQNVTPLVMLDAQDHITGILRVVSMGNKFAYVCDEVMNQDLAKTFIPDDKARELFLLAYLMNKASETVLTEARHAFIIAAKGREALYAQVGCQEFPLNLPGWKVVMNFGPEQKKQLEMKKAIQALPVPNNTPPSPHVALSLLAPLSIAGATPQQAQPVPAAAQRPGQVK